MAIFVEEKFESSQLDQPYVHQKKRIFINLSFGVLQQVKSLSVFLNTLVSLPAKQNADFVQNYPPISAVFVRKNLSMVLHPPWYKPILTTCFTRWWFAAYFLLICCRFSTFCSVDIALILPCRVMWS